MKKIILVLAVLMLAAPVMAVSNNITITAICVDSNFPAEVEITYDVTSGKIPRAFALDITVDAGTITDVGNFFVGECNDSNGYGIFPASFNRYINADDPNWADVNYTPVAELGDLPGDTQPGLVPDSNGVTIEMGSLYAAPKGPPEDSGTLCSIFVDSSCHVDLALNVGRAGIVMEDGNPPDNIAFVEEDVALVCTVPPVVSDANLIAQAAIIAANFTIGNITAECSDTIADGNVISTDPAAGVATCGSTVAIVVSTGPCVVVCDCPGDVSQLGDPGVPDGQITDADLGYVNGLLVLHGGRFRVIESSSEYFDLCADVSQLGDPGVPDGKITDADLGYINGRLVLEGGRFRIINCP